MAQVKIKDNVLHDNKCKGKKADKELASPHKYEYYPLFVLNC